MARRWAPFCLLPVKVEVAETVETCLVHLKSFCNRAVCSLAAICCMMEAHTSELQITTAISVHIYWALRDF